MIHWKRIVDLFSLLRVCCCVTFCENEAVVVTGGDLGVCADVCRGQEKQQESEQETTKSPNMEERLYDTEVWAEIPQQE